MWRTDRPTDRRTDRPTDRRTDKAGCRVACTRLKKSFNDAIVTFYWQFYQFWGKESVSIVENGLRSISRLKTIIFSFQGPDWAFFALISWKKQVALQFWQFQDEELFYLFGKMEGNAILQSKMPQGNILIAHRLIHRPDWAFLAFFGLFWVKKSTFEGRIGGGISYLGVSIFERILIKLSIYMNKK